MRGLKIRWKLTLWYGLALAIVLMLFGTAVFVMMRHHLMERIDQGLAEELADVLSEIRRSDSSAGLKEWLHRRFAAHAGFDFQITRFNGERYFYSKRLSDKAWALPAVSSEDAVFNTVPIPSKGNWRIVDILVQGPEGPLTVQVGRSLATFEHESNELLMTFLLAGPLALLAAIAGGYFLAGRVLQPIQSITQTAKIISADRLNERIPIVTPDDELGELAQTMNLMIERLGRSITEMQRFTADAAHELRTPLAILRNEAEVALRQPRSAAEYCCVLENLLEDTNRFSAMTDQLLFLSRQDTGTSTAVRETVALDVLLRDIVGNMKPVAQEKGISLTLRDNPPCRLTSDGRLLQRVFINLLDNATKYTEPGGHIEVTSDVSADSVTVRVSDSGIGIRAEHLPYVFDRFYRVDPSRSSDSGGSGLGLSICKSIMRSLNGTITMESKPGAGTTVSVTMPVN